MHILFVTGTYAPSVNGVAVATKKQKEALEKKGHKVTVLAPKYNGAEDEPGVIRYPAIENPFVKDYPAPLFPGVKSIYKLIETKKPDIVHAHHPFHVGYFAWVIAKRYKVPLVFTYHSNYDAYAREYLKLLPIKLKRKFMDNSVSKFCEKADLVIFPSKMFEKRINNKLPFVHTKYLPSGVDFPDKKFVSKANSRKKINIPSDKTVLLTVGRLAPEKNTRKAIEALALLPEKYILLIVGEGHERKKLEKLTTKFNLTNRVMFVGSVVYDEIPNYYNTADMFLFTSDIESQGLVYLEAAFFGLPVVAVNSFAARQWVKPSFGIVADNTALKIADAVLKLDKKDKRKVKNAGQKFSKRYTLSKMTNELEKIYISLLQNLYYFQ